MTGTSRLAVWSDWDHEDYSMIAANPLPDTRKARGGQRPPSRHAFVAVVVALLSAACTHQSARVAVQPQTVAAVGADIRVAACRDALSAASLDRGTGLDGANIRLFNWNVQKKHGPEWRRDFDRLTMDADLVLMQEASLADHTTGVADGRFSTFAPGYRTGTRVTGVLTMSRSKPLAHCSFTSREPWLRTPKATSISAYALAGVDQTLAVVNLHAVNFSFGLSDYRAQFARVRDVLHDHSGPIILAGDFNTWRGRRLAVVRELARALELESVSFVDDERVRFFGFALDHIYVRDLALRESGTVGVTTSDHNPMTAVLAMAVVAK